MGVATRATTLGLMSAVLLGACNANDGAHRAGSETNRPIPAAATSAAPIAAPGYATPPPDVEGNPPCPVADAWGKAPTDKGIFVTYWGSQPDYVTALVRTSLGTDYAKSANIDPVAQPIIFDFPNIDVATVREVLITTNVRRCFATPDPATSGR